MTAPNQNTAYIALGANLGDRERNIRDALRRLAASSEISIRKISSLLENPAVGGPAGAPSFLNVVAEIETTLSPRALLQRLLAVEHELGRERHEKWEPRKIDLDLILYGNMVIDEPDLIVPHPRMHERRFVLQPLAEIAPQVLHPVLHQKAAALLQNLGQQ